MKNNLKQQPAVPTEVPTAVELTSREIRARSGSYYDNTDLYTCGGVFALTKDERMPNVEIKRTVDADLRRLMNYQYYRISKPLNYNALRHATHYFRTLNSVNIYTSGYQFAAMEPTLVFEFFDRLYLCF